MINYSNINGHLVAAGEASLKVSDLSVLRGFAIFDFFLFRKGHPLFLNDYLDRFYRSAQLLHMEVPFSKTDFARQIIQLIERNGQEEGGIRLLLTGGYSPDGYSPAEPNVLILQYPLPAKTWQSSQGIKLMTHTFLREIPEVKTTNYVTGISLLPELKRCGFDDLLFVENGEWIRESVRSNFFLVFDGQRVVTPGNKVLLGVTRKQILHLAGKRYPVEERDVHISELKEAHEAFFTSTIKGVLPVVQIDDQLIGDGKPGLVSAQLYQDFISHVEAYLEEQSRKARQLIEA
ncbi:MAG: aminotransferase class IV family protein [Haliscomenobacter sp.]|nr:aminotransferase class IV family protein [Haliscomenobacter sp.]